MKLKSILWYKTNNREKETMNNMNENKKQDIWKVEGSSKYGMSSKSKENIGSSLQNNVSKLC